MTQPEQPTTRSRTDRAGQLAFTVVVCGLLALLIVWGAAHIWPQWWFWPYTIVFGLIWLAVTGTGIAASLDKRPRGGR